MVQVAYSDVHLGRI
ncbi:hypothetical protein MIMGU_mgv11b0112342mg, partial [Erythranthe guttata]